MQSPLLGFNNNVRHRGRLFHIQTEDSGVRHPHVITHLYMDGGRILKTVKTSYAAHVGSDRLGEVVRELMKEQHKKMFIALRDGQFDQALDPNHASPTPPLGVASIRDAVQSMPASIVGASREAAAPGHRPPSELVSGPALGAARADHAPGRYAVSRPAALFASGHNPEAVASIFGDELIGEKSLDEVILSYLSEDLDTSPTKK